MVKDLYQQAEILYVQRRFQEASQPIQQFLRENPEHGNANAFAATIFAKMEDYSTAKSYAEKALSIIPRIPNQLMSLAPIFCMTGEVDKGISLLEEALALCKEDTKQSLKIDIHYNLAKAYALKGDLPKANELIREAKTMEQRDLFESNLAIKYGVPNLGAREYIDLLKELMEEGQDGDCSTILRKYINKQPV